MKHSLCIQCIMYNISETRLMIHFKIILNTEQRMKMDIDTQPKQKEAESIQAVSTASGTFCTFCNLNTAGY